MKKMLFEKFSGIRIRTGYYPLLLLLSIIWMFYYSPVSDSMSRVSFIAQQIAMFSLLQIADSVISNKKIRFSLAGISFLYIFLIHFNALLISITSMTLYESVTVLALGGDFLYTLEEAGLFIGFIALLVLLLVLIFSAGGFANRSMPYKNLQGNISGVILVSIFLLTIIFFITEQYTHRNLENFFSRRVYPLYFEIFCTNNDSVTYSIAGSTEPDMDLYKKITAPGNPKNVLFIQLESFRSDAVNHELSPFMKGLADDSPEFTNYYTDAVYTSLAWNTLFMDRPGYTLSHDISSDNINRGGSHIFRIFKNAGYDTYFASSANLEWKSFHERINGKDKLIDNYYCGYEKREEERNFIDTRTTAKTEEWIRKSPHTRPFFMMIQLDSTHWTYFTDKEYQISKPFAGKDINIGKLKNSADIELLLNRYKNSVRKVNSCVEKIITSLKRSSRYNDTVIVIVSDHGEGFAPGMIGHSVLHDDIKKPAFIMHIPGIKKFKTDKFVSHMNIFPTIFDILKIGGTEKIIRGRSILDKNYSRDCVLSVHGSILMADLTFKDYIVFFRIKRCKDSITFTPVKYTDRSGNIINKRESTEWKSALKKIIEEEK